jgi:(p)ppGpp synthase/HD superfamily hydrolase
MKALWSPDLFYKAFNYAASAHNGQTVPGTELPYVTHITGVCAELMAVITAKDDGDLIIQCSALHDTIEDTKTTFEDLKLEFGKEVAEGVLSLSKNPELHKSIRMEDSLSRIVKQPPAIWMVKMADRINNLNPPPEFWTLQKRRNYLNEALVIYETLKEANIKLADRLKQKIIDYEIYL